MSASRTGGGQRAAIWWVAVLAWMVVIFMLSSQPDPDDTGGLRFHIGVYKLAHLIEFTVLGGLVLGATQHLNLPRAAWWTWVFVVLYAISDEIHQSFVPGRTPLVTDVAIDSLGGILGILGFAMAGNIREGRIWPPAVLVGRRPAPADVESIDGDESLGKAG